MLVLVVARLGSVGADVEVETEAVTTPGAETEEAVTRQSGSQEADRVLDVRDLEEDVTEEGEGEPLDDDSPEPEYEDTIHPTELTEIEDGEINTNIDYQGDETLDQNMTHGEIVPDKVNPEDGEVSEEATISSDQEIAYTNEDTMEEDDQMTKSVICFYTAPSATFSSLPSTLTCSCQGHAATFKVSKEPNQIFWPMNLTP